MAAATSVVTLWNIRINSATTQRAIERTATRPCGLGPRPHQHAQLHDCCEFHTAPRACGGSESALTVGSSPPRLRVVGMRRPYSLACPLCEGRCRQRTLAGRCTRLHKVSLHSTLKAPTVARGSCERSHSELARARPVGSPGFAQAAWQEGSLRSRSYPLPHSTLYSSCCPSPSDAIFWSALMPAVVSL
jgi:hypothetical protein